MYVRYLKELNNLNGLTQSSENQNFTQLQLMKIEDEHERMSQLMNGKVDVECDSTVKIVRIFTSSTFTDTKEERNILMTDAYPKLKKYCQIKGYEFQVVDMRWGIRESAENNQKTTELCIQEVIKCQNISTGPFFVTFLSHKYGYRPIPNRIEMDEFKRMKSQVPIKDRKLLRRWFKKDFNAEPSSYVMVPISTNFPDFINRSNPDLQKIAKQKFWEESDRLQNIIGQAVKSIFTPSECEKYLISVSESEIKCGLLNVDNPNDKCIWFKRDIIDIEQQERSKLYSRFYECRGETEEAIEESRQLLKQLKEVKIPAKLASSNIVQYQVKWDNEKGINPVKSEEHRKYLQKFSQDFVIRLKDLIAKGIKNKEQSHSMNNKLYKEVIEHISFCQNKYANFTGRHDLLMAAKSYLTDDENNSPFVIHGKSGSGKTSVMAAIAWNITEWFPSSKLIVRFLGTTQESCNIKDVLLNLCQHINHIYNIERNSPEPNSIKEVIEDFKETLEELDSDPLIILLDSIDQLDRDYSALQCKWLPFNLQKNVKIIISTLQEEDYEVLPNLKNELANENRTDNFLELTSLESTTVKSILQMWLDNSNRSLTHQQMQLILDKFQNLCSLPLYLRLCFDEAINWTSFQSIDSIELGDSVRQMIDLRFSKLEKDHGLIFVSHLLAYLTLSKVGLSDNELEDILSLDDEVLNDTYQHSVPPIRKLPPLLLVRVKNDISEYLVNRGNENVQISYWYHRQFIEAAYNRYCSNEETRIKYHTLMAEYFMGIWADRPKPFIDKNQHENQALRYITDQPVCFDDHKHVINSRKLMELPYHLMNAKLKEELKKYCLMNYEFLQAKIIVKSLSVLFEDFHFAKDLNLLDDDEIALQKALQISTLALNYDPYLLPSELYGRLESKSKPLKELIKTSLENTWRPIFIPDKSIFERPGGSLIHLLVGHNGSINSIDLSQDKSTIVTCSSEDHSIKLWNISKGSLSKSIDGYEPTFVKFCMEDSHLLFESDHKLIRLRVDDTNETCLDKDNISGLFFMLRDRNRGLVWLKKDRINLIDIDPFQEKSSWSLLDLKISKLDLGSVGNIVGVGIKYLGISLESQEYSIILFDLENGKFVSKTNVFPAPTSDEDDESFPVNTIEFNGDESIIFYSNYMDNDIYLRYLPNMDIIGYIKGNPDWFLQTPTFLKQNNSILYSDRNGIKYIKLCQNNQQMSILLDEPIKFDNASAVDMSLVNLLSVTNYDQYAAVDMKTVAVASEDFSIRLFELNAQDNTNNNSSAQRHDLYTTSQDDAFFQLFMSQMTDTEQQFDSKSLEWNSVDHFMNDQSNLLCSAIVKFKNSQVKKNSTIVFAVLAIYNTQDNKYTNIVAIKNIQQSFSVTIIDNERALLSTKPKYLLNYTQLEFINSFVGQFHSEFVSVDSNELYSLTKGYHNIKVYNIDSGDCSRFIKGLKPTIEETEENITLSDIMVIEKGRIGLLLDSEMNQLLIFDVPTQEPLSRIKISSNKAEEDIVTDISLHSAVYNQVHKLLIFESNAALPEQYKQSDEALVDEAAAIFVYDLSNPTLPQFRHVLVDWETHVLLQKSNSDHDMTIDAYFMLNEDVLCVTTYSQYWYLWNIITGEMLGRYKTKFEEVSNMILPYKYTTNKRIVQSNNIDKMLPERIMNFNTTDNYMCSCLWKLQDSNSNYQQFSTLKYDHTPRKHILSGNNIYGWYQNQFQPVIWSQDIISLNKYFQAIYAEDIKFIDKDSIKFPNDSKEDPDSDIEDLDSDDSDNNKNDIEASNESVGKSSVSDFSD